DSDKDSNKDMEKDSKEITLADAQRLEYQLYGVANQLNSSIVRIRTGGKSWSEENLASNSEACGIIIAQEYGELIILTEQWVIEGEKNIGILFYDGSAATAVVKGYNQNIGIAALSVDVYKLPLSTKKSFSVAKIGSSRAISRGMYTIAVGSPQGDTYSAAVGHITSVNHMASYIDGVFPLLTTDIASCMNGKGFLIDSSGRMVGILTHDGDIEGSNTLQAISISEIKPFLENLANGQVVPYLGLEILTVTDTMAKEYNLPRGVYVKKVGMNSPSMQAGIQNGDIIIQMENEEISSAYGYQQYLAEATPGEQLRVLVMRYGKKNYKEIECKVTIGQTP
ncbi:MAG: S1C family serine protease, partial [Lachnospiraceae bacterium]